jgi:CheY-like chemotaxis protein
VPDEEKGYALGADEYCVKPVTREILLGALERLTGVESLGEQRQSNKDNNDLPARRVLIVDDQSADRYVVAKLINSQHFILRQATSGTDGLRMAKQLAPDFIFLDLDMPDISGFEVLSRLKSDPALRAIPVAIVTSLVLSEAQRQDLARHACAIVNKSELSRAHIEQLLTKELAESAERRVTADSWS